MKIGGSALIVFAANLTILHLFAYSSFEIMVDRYRCANYHSIIGR
jgi:hypothetical protein